MHWYLLVERMWRPELSALANTSIKGMSPKQQVAAGQNRSAAQALIQSLFPEDDDDE